jgi:acyl-CoA reductase-like NAD-dependent aldehyde dehydrogenase
LPLAVSAATYGAFVHQGEVCMCVRRIIVDRSVADAFIPAFVARVASLPVGDPHDPATVVGPLINEWADALISRRVAEAVSLGATVLTGGSAVGPCYRPTVLTDVPAAAEIAFEETFGPVALIEVVDGPAEAVTRANDSRFGLTAGIISADVYRSLDLAQQLSAGIVHVNDQTVNDEPQMPFGGVKESGWGRFGLGFTTEDFTDQQWITLRDSPRDYPF